MDAGQFVASWLEGWNAHDLEAVLRHFHDDVIFTSPVAKKVAPSTGGRLHGKEALRGYWSRALAAIPDLRFEVERYFVGIGAIVIQYRNQNGIVVDEVLILDGNLVIQGYGTYPDGVPNPAGLAGNKANHPVK